MIDEKTQRLIDKFIEEAGALHPEEPLDGDETQEIAQQIQYRLDTLFANEPAKKFAQTSWCVEDVYEEADSIGVQIDEEEAENLLTTYEDKIIDAMVSAGWDVIREALLETHKR